MSSSYLPPFPNLTFKTVVVRSLLNSYSKSVDCGIIAAFAVTSASFFNSSLQANVVSRMEIDDKTIKLVTLFLLTSATTRNNLSTIQMTPVLHLENFSHPDVLINTLKNSTYFTRSLKHLTVRNHNAGRLLQALEKLVALEVLELAVIENIPQASEQDLSVISRLPSLTEVNLDIPANNGEFAFVDFLGDLGNNNSFRKLSLRYDGNIPHQNFQTNFARLCSKNLLSHLTLQFAFNDEDLDVLIRANLTDLRSLKLLTPPMAVTGSVSSSRIADAIIASSPSLTTLHVGFIDDDDLIKCAEYLEKLVELRLRYSSVDGSFLREKGSCFSSRLEIFDVLWSCLSDEYLKDGFKYLTSLRNLDVNANQYFSGADSLPYLTAASSLEELKVGRVNSECLRAIGQLTQLRSLHVRGVEDDVKSEDVTLFKSLVKLRKLTFFTSTKELYDGILKIAESFQKLEHVKLSSNLLDKTKRPEFSRDQVTYLLEQCWPMVRHAIFEYDDPSAAMPHLRSRFPHVNFGDRDEEVARNNQSNTVTAFRLRSP